MRKLFILLIFISLLFGKEKWLDTSYTHEERVQALIDELTIEEKAVLIRSGGEVKRLNIATNSFVECLHGVARKGRATVFPQSIGLGATFDTDLMYRVAVVISDEVRAKHNSAKEIGNTIGINALSPNINIFRDPRWGRGQETYGEDPYLTGKMGVAFVKGIQGNDPNYLKVSACAKHFAVHSGPEPMRHVIDPNPTKKDLFETYLPAFEMLVKEADVQTIMATYNKVNGVSCCANGFLLDEILQKRWGFEGVAMSDGGAIVDLYTVQNAAESKVDASAMCLNNGLHFNLGRTFTGVPEAVEQGLLSETTIDEALTRWLHIQMKLGQFDPPGSTPYDKLDASMVNCDKHRKLAREAAQKSIVMLKNNDVLPLGKNIKRLYVIGNNAFTSEPLIGNYYGLSDKMPTVLEGLMSKVHAGAIVEYRPGVRLDQESKTLADWTDVSHRFDAIVAVMGVNSMMEGEEGAAIASPDGGDRRSLHLPKNQIDYLKQQRAYGDKPIIVVLFGGSPIIDEELYELADAVLFAWYPGEEGGNAVADIIFGDACPSAKLPVTFPKDEKDLPKFEDYTMEGRTYKYMEKEPLFPFGFGLSYTTFEYSKIRLSDKKLSRNDGVKVTCLVKNTGDIAGEEVVQLYLTLPKNGQKNPKFSLVGFQKIILNPGEKKKVNFEIRPENMIQIDKTGEADTPCGNYKITIGGCSPVKFKYDNLVPKLLTENFIVK